MAPTYLRELISRRESSVNTRLGADHHQPIMPPISIIIFITYTPGTNKHTHEKNKKN